MHIVTVTGNVGRDAELKYTPQNLAIVNFSVASKFRTKVDGKWESQTQWFKCIAFGQKAEQIAKWVMKGREVVVIGQLKIEEYYDKDGKARVSAEVLVDQYTLMGKRDSESQSAPRTARPVAQDDPFAPPADDDIPF
jgi:single-strand DNA-binding protein